MNNKIVTRYYNNISFSSDRVIKGVSGDRFIKETEWFKEAVKRIPTNIPRIYKSNKLAADPDGKFGKLEYYEMQRIDGDNLYQWAINHKRSATTKVFDELIAITKFLHQESHHVNEDDIYQMYYLKPKIALENFINKFRIDCDSLIINNINIKNPVITLENIFKRFKNSLLKTRYSFIHGDLTMSNTLVDKKGVLYLIDPRGGFGNTRNYGDVRYDVAKLYYSIVGNFDSLNNGQFKYQLDKSKANAHTYSIVDNEFGFYKDKLLNEFHEDPEIIEFIHATIWLSLLPHVVNNPDQQFCVFCNGVSLINLFT